MAAAVISRCRSPASATGVPSTARMVSVVRRPARSAGLPSVTSMTPTPRAVSCANRKMRVAPDGECLGYTSMSIEVAC